MKWSYSAHAAMRRCQRMFIFGHVMPSYNARDPERRKAYVLKQLQHISAWQGSVVHQVLASQLVPALRSGYPVSPAALASVAIDLARRQFAFSAAHRYREPGQSKRAARDEYCALFAHEHDWSVGEEDISRVEKIISGCFHHLDGQTDFLATLRAGSNHVAEPPLSFRLNGTTILATPDLVFLRRNGGLSVVDWKIAASGTSDYSRQLLVYALAVMRCGRWPGVSAEEIELVEANLLRDAIRYHPVSAARLDDAEDFLYRSLSDMEALIGPRRFEELDMDEFDVAEKPGTCRHCNFNSLCVRRLAAASEPAEAMAAQGRLW